MFVGIAEIDCTPPLGLSLMGNYRDDYAARGVHDRLYARALAIRADEGSACALVSVDVCMLGRAEVAAVRQAASQATGLAREDILVAATHTHSSLAATSLMALPVAPAEAIREFTGKIAEAIVQAWHGLAPAEVAVGYATESRVSFNRRLHCRDGRTHMNWERLDPDFVVRPLGPVDDRMATLWIQRPEDAAALVSRSARVSDPAETPDRRSPPPLETCGRPEWLGQRPATTPAVAALVNFALHPAILAGDNWLYSADYPGELAAALRRLMGPEFVTLFGNGCCGDVNHLDYRDPLQGRGFKMTERVGHMLAVAAAQARRRAVPVNTEPLLVSRERVSLPRWRISDEQCRWCHEILARAATQPAAGQVDGLPDELYARVWLDMHAQQDQPDEVEVMVIRLGDVAFVGLPGEIFCELGLAIRQGSPAPHTFVIELANDAIGYLPPRHAFDEGGYEPTPGSTQYEPGAGEQLVASALRQLRSLFAELA